MAIFLTDEVELRPGWKFAVYLMAYAAIFLSTSALLSEFIPQGSEPFGGVLDGLILSVLVFFPPAVLSFVFVLRFVERRPPSAFGVAFSRGWSADFALGTFVAGAMVAIFMVGGTVAGTWTFETSPPPGDPGYVLPMTIFLLGIAAANEELVYRGYPLQVLMMAVGRAPAIVIMSTIFGLGHYLNPNATWLATFNVCLAGVLLSVAYLRTRSLWLPYGIHVGWNLTTGVLLGLPVSGVRLSSVWRVDLDGASWVTGGSFGPEGGILSTIAIIAAGVFVARTRSTPVDPEIPAAMGAGKL